MNKSFTLIEILVVIVVVGILSSFILVGMSSISESANIAKSKAFSESLDNAPLLNRVSQWKLDDTSGTSASDSWLTNTGTLTNFADTSSGHGDTHDSGWMSSTNCISGTCLKFDGTDDHISISNSNSINITGSTLTMSAWFYSTTATTGYVLARNNVAPADIQYGFYKDTSSSAVNRIYVYIDGLCPAQSPVNSILNDKWYNVAILYNGTNVAIYINGSLSRTPQAYNNSLLSTSYNLNIGRRSPSDVYFGGLIDDVRIYNQAISTSQIKQNYFLGLNRLLKNNNIKLTEFNQRITEIEE